MPNPDYTDPLAKGSAENPASEESTVRDEHVDEKSRRRATKLMGGLLRQVSLVPFENAKRILRLFALKAKVSSLKVFELRKARLDLGTKAYSLECAPKGSHYEKLKSINQQIDILNSDPDPLVSVSFLKSSGQRFLFFQKYIKRVVLTFRLQRALIEYGDIVLAGSPSAELATEKSKCDRLRSEIQEIESHYDLPGREQSVSFPGKEEFRCAASLFVVNLQVTQKKLFHRKAIVGAVVCFAVALAAARVVSKHNEGLEVATNSNSGDKQKVTSEKSPDSKRITTTGKPTDSQTESTSHSQGNTERTAKPQHAAPGANSAETKEESKPQQKVNISKPIEQNLNQSYAKYRRGPVFKGFQLGMTLVEFEANLKKVYPEVGDDIYYRFGDSQKIGDELYDVLLDENKKWKETDFTSKNGYPLCKVQTIGKPKIVLGITFYDKLIYKMFDLEGMSFREFCQNMINSYGIPKLEPVPNDSGRMSDLGYHSREQGYNIVFMSTFYVSLAIGRKEADRDRGFGR